MAEDSASERLKTPLVQPLHLLPARRTWIMAETVSPDMKCVYVDTNLGTRLVVIINDHETIFDFKEKLCKEHHQCFPELGEIDISAVKVKRQGSSGLLLDYHLPDSMFLSKVFKGVNHNCWIVFVDAAVRIVELPKADKNCLNLEEIAATISLRLDGYTKNQNPEEEEELETGVAEKRKLELSDGEKSRKKPKVDDLSQSAATTELSPREKQDQALAEAARKEIEVGEKSLEDEVRDNIEPSDNPVSHSENHLDTTNSGLTTRPDTEKEKKRSKDDINQSPAMTSSRDTTIDGGVHANVDATPQSIPSSYLDNSSSEAKQKENDMGENVVEDVGRDKIESDNLMENPLDTNTGLTARPDTEKKKRSNDDVNQSLAALTTSGDIVNEINRVPAIVDYVDDSLESLPVPKGEKSFVEAASQKDIDMCDVDNIDQFSDAAISTSRDIVNEINEVPANAAPESLPIARGTPFAESSQKENEMFVEDVGRDNIEPNSGWLLATRQDKSSKDDINQSFPAATGSGGIVNEINGVAGNEDPVGGATLESLLISTRRENLGIPYAEASQIARVETETGEKINDDIVGGGKAAADDIQPCNVETDADEAKSVKPTKKRKSKKSKTLAEEDTLVAAHNVEPIKAADGEEPDKVVLGSLKEKNETTEEKTVKKSKKKHSLKVAKSQILSVEVNSTPLEETSHINSTNDSFLTPAKKDTETDALLLKKCYEEKGDDMGDNFGCSQNQEKQDQVGGGGVKSIKEKSGLDLHPSASTNVSLSSLKPKERKSRVKQTACSGTYREQQSRVKSVSVRSAAVKSKKQDVKKISSNPLTVDKVKTNFFKDAEKCNSSEDEYKRTSHVSTETQGNNLAGGANKSRETLQDIIRRSSSYKKALILTQSQPDIHDDSPGDFVPDSESV